MARFLRAQEDERARIAIEKHRKFQEEEEAKRARQSEDFRVAWNRR